MTFTLRFFNLLRALRIPANIKEKVNTTGMTIIAAVKNPTNKEMIRADQALEPMGASGMFFPKAVPHAANTKQYASVDHSLSRKLPVASHMPERIIMRAEIQAMNVGG